MTTAGSMNGTTSPRSHPTFCWRPPDALGPEAFDLVEPDFRPVAAYIGAGEPIIAACQRRVLGRGGELLRRGALRRAGKLAARLDRLPGRLNRGPRQPRRRMRRGTARMLDTDRQRTPFSPWMAAPDTDSGQAAMRSEGTVSAGREKRDFNGTREDDNRCGPDARARSSGRDRNRSEGEAPATGPEGHGCGTLFGRSTTRGGRRAVRGACGGAGRRARLR